MLDLGGKSILMSALAPVLSACGGSSGGSNGNQTAAPSGAIPAASAEYSTLKRTSFGVSRTSLSDIQALGIDTYLERQLDYSAIDDGDLEATIDALFPLSTQSADQLIAGFPDNIAEVARQLASATQYRQIYSNRQLYEVMVEFWSDHFNIHVLNGLGPTLKPADDQNVIRQHALGNFGDLLRASSKSAAMLFYLDSFNNLASAPNENYARELMELHTLGVDGGYTEADIQEVARCFTGWSLRFPNSGTYGEFVFQPAWHDYGEKEVLGQVIAAGGGQIDGETVIDILLAHPSTAQFIATKLCKRFISDTPSMADVNTVADVFTDSGGDIKDTLRAVFALDAFVDEADSKFIRPSEYLAQMIRTLAPSGYPTDSGALFYAAQSILGQLPFFWPTPDGYPDTESYWASTGGLLNRWRLSFISLAPVIPEINVISIDYEALLEGARTLETIVSALEQNLLLRELAPLDRQRIASELADTYEQDVDTDLGNDVAVAIAPLVAAILISSSYFQMR